MNRSSSTRTPALVAAGALVTVIAVFAFATSGFGRSGDPVGPTTPPSASPDVSPGTTPDPSPSVPVDHGPIDGDVVIDLDTVTPHAVSARVRDTTGHLVRAISGRPGAGMSVRWHDIAVSQVDERTVSVTWVGLATDEGVHVDISTEAGGYVIEIVQAGPQPQSDALGHDRVLILSFDEPIVATDVTGGVADRS
jgi:hypothetical protein